MSFGIYQSELIFEGKSRESPEGFRRLKTKMSFGTGFRILKKF